MCYKTNELFIHLKFELVVEVKMLCYTVFLYNFFLIKPHENNMALQTNQKPHIKYYVKDKLYMVTVKNDILQSAFIFKLVMHLG